MIKIIFATVFILCYTVFFIHNCFFTKVGVGGAALFFAFFNMPTSIVVDKFFFPIVVDFFKIDGLSAINQAAEMYVAGLIQWGGGGYFLGCIAKKFYGK